MTILRLTLTASLFFLGSTVAIAQDQPTAASTPTFPMEMKPTAEGARVSGYGRVELYVGGKLFYVLMIRRNADLAVGACSFDGDDPCTYEREKKLYPCLDRNRRRR